MAGAALRLLSLILALVAVIGVLLSPWIVSSIAMGFKADPWQYELTVLLSRIMFPYVIFICLVALCMGVLNVLGHFAVPSLAPVALNVSMIAALFVGGLVTAEGETRVVILAWGVLLGELCSWLCRSPCCGVRGSIFLNSGRCGIPGLPRWGG